MNLTPGGHCGRSWLRGFDRAYLGWVWAVWCLHPAILPAQDPLTVEGLVPRGSYADRVVFRILAAPDYSYSCSLDEQRVEVGTWIQVDQPDYYELLVRRTRLGTAQEEAQKIGFVVYASRRGLTEFGLPPWTPYPVVNASVAEVEGLQVRLVMPARFPTGIPIPAIACLEQADGRPAWHHGVVTISGWENQPLQLRRGFGSALLLPMADAGKRNVQARLHLLQTSRLLELESAPAWLPVAGRLHGSFAWPENSRIRITNDLEIATNSTLHIGAGSLIQIAPRINLTVNGRCVVQGTREQPVVFFPIDRREPWGGFLLTNSAAELEFTGAILTGGGGDPDYFTHHFGYAHRMEQPVLLLHHGARAALTNCYFIQHAGQMANGYDATLILDHCLVQRCVLAGQFDGSSVTINQSALIEFPEDTAEFADADEDALYLKSGHHLIRDTVIGWTRDDGIDAQVSEGSSFTVTNCWFEACYHEGMAWSSVWSRAIDRAEVRHTVVVNCGQGIEQGYSAGQFGSLVVADQVFCSGNLVGARLGDNYNWEYLGFLRVTNSFLLYNRRDVWGMTWNDWEYRQGQMDLRNNFFSEPNPRHPENWRWDGNADGWRLQPFVPGVSGPSRGVAFAVRQQQMEAQQLARGLPVGLSLFSTAPVGVDYTIESEAGLLDHGRIEFSPGEILKTIRPVAANPDWQGMIQVSLSHPQNAEVTGWKRVFFLPSDASTAPRIYWRRSGADLLMAWSGSNVTLEQASAVQGPWTSRPDAISPLVMETALAARYYRLMVKAPP